jgi:TolB protein
MDNDVRFYLCKGQVKVLPGERLRKPQVPDPYKGRELYRTVMESAHKMRDLIHIIWVSALIALGIHAQGPITPIYYHNPDWSPDGRSVVFESTKDGKSAIYTIGIDGTGIRRLTDTAAASGQPRWSRDGKKIAFYGEVDGRMQIFLMNKDGSGMRRLTDSPTLDYLPDISPSGDMVVFQSRVERPAVAHDLFVVRTDGTNRKQLTDAKFGYTSPKWSPDGKKIVFVRAIAPKKYYREMSREDVRQMRGSEEIVVMDRDGSQPVDLTRNNANDSSPQWSHNGKTIYFMSDRDGSPWVYAMKADGTDPRKIAAASVVANPFVSPNEKYFAYTKEVDGKWGLYIYEIKSRKERLLIGN